MTRKIGPKKKSDFCVYGLKRAGRKCTVDVGITSPLTDTNVKSIKSVEERRYAANRYVEVKNGKYSKIARANGLDLDYQRQCHLACGWGQPPSSSCRG